jgi:hypothetical protein
MHDTLHSNVKGFIDVNHGGKLEGWAFHEMMGILPLRLKYGNGSNETEMQEQDENNKYEMLIPLLRNDVADFYVHFHHYNRNYISYSGFSIENEVLLSGKVRLEIEIQIDGQWAKIFDLSVFNPVINIEIAPSFVVVDNFYKHPDAVREFALNQIFVLHPNNHKGKRTDDVFRFPGLQESFEKHLGVRIKNWTKYGTNGCFQYCIAGDQLVYHYDGQEYAGVLFLTPDAPPQSGTTLHRSKYTKSMTVKPEEEGIVFKNGYLDPTEFDVVDVVGNVYNRLVLFNAKMIHSASSYFGTDSKNGRLFQLFFFDLDIPSG